MKKRNFWDYLFNICVCIATLAFVASIVFMVYTLTRDDVALFPAGQIYEMDKWNYTDASGDTCEYTTPFTVDLTGVDKPVFTAKLPKVLPNGSVFAILNRTDIKIYVGNRQIYSWEKSEAPLPGGPAKNAYLFVNLKSEYAGKEIRVVRDDPDYSGVMLESFVGPKDEVIRQLEKKSGFGHFIASAFLLLLSLTIIFVCILLRVILKQTITLVYGALGIFVSACWLTVDSYMFQFVTRTRYIDGFMSYMCTLAILFPFIIYLDLVQKSRYRKIYSFVALLEMINILLFPALHLMGIQSLADSLVVLDTILGVGILVTFLITFFDLRKPVAKSYRIIAMGFLVLMVCSVVEILLINLYKDRTQGTVLVLGLYILLGFGVVQQTEDLKKVQLERSAANAAALAKTKFLANMSHEIRTPINSILGMNEMIMKENDNPTIGSYSKLINESGQILLSLINDVLDFSKIQSGISDIECGNYNPTKLFERVAAILEERAATKNLKVKIGTTQNMPKVLYGDEKHILQVLLNLVTNAVKYTDEGTVTFSADCRREGDKCVLVFYVSDTGQGIKKEDTASIFDPFIRKELKKNRSVQGTGLGLAITKELVEQMGGSIQVDSVFGKGSTFLVEIPQEIREADAILDSGTEDDDLSGIDENYTAPDARVLAVDDNGSNLIVIQEFLKGTSIKLDVVSSGGEAVRKCEAYKYDVILMDHMMPDPDGIATMHMIRESKGGLNESTPQIILTANAIKGSKESYLNEGFENYLSKPVSSKQLLRMVRKYLPENKVMHKSATIKKNKSGRDNAPLASMTSGPVDLKALYERFENRESTINVILTEIVKEGEKKIALLPKLFYEGDIENYAIEAHGVKGVMASSCADALSETAKAHEFAAKEGRVDFIRDNIDDFLKEYRNVLDYIINYLGSRGISVKVSGSIDISNIDEATEEELINASIEALNDFDVDKALTFLNRLKEVANKEKSGKIEEIISYADDFEYLKAVEGLKRLQIGE